MSKRHCPGQEADMDQCKPAMFVFDTHELADGDGNESDGDELVPIIPAQMVGYHIRAD